MRYYVGSVEETSMNPIHVDLPLSEVQTGGSGDIIDTGGRGKAFEEAFLKALDLLGLQYENSAGGQSAMGYDLRPVGLGWHKLIRDRKTNVKVHSTRWLFSDRSVYQEMIAASVLVREKVLTPEQADKRVERAVRQVFSQKGMPDIAFFKPKDATVQRDIVAASQSKDTEKLKKLLTARNFSTRRLGRGYEVIVKIDWSKESCAPHCGVKIKRENSLEQAAVIHVNGGVSGRPFGISGRVEYPKGDATFFFRDRSGINSKPHHYAREKGSIAESLDRESDDYKSVGVQKAAEDAKWSIPSDVVDYAPDPKPAAKLKKIVADCNKMLAELDDLVSSVVTELEAKDAGEGTYGDLLDWAETFKKISTNAQRLVPSIRKYHDSLPDWWTNWRTSPSPMNAPGTQLQATWVQVMDMLDMTMTDIHKITGRLFDAVNKFYLLADEEERRGMYNDARVDRQFTDSLTEMVSQLESLYTLPFVLAYTSELLLKISRMVKETTPHAAARLVADPTRGVPAHARKRALPTKGRARYFRSDWEMVYWAKKNLPKPKAANLPNVVKSFVNRDSKKVLQRLNAAQDAIHEVFFLELVRNPRVKPHNKAFFNAIDDAIKSVRKMVKAVRALHPYVYNVVGETLEYMSSPLDMKMNTPNDPDSALWGLYTATKRVVLRVMDDHGAPKQWKDLVGMIDPDARMGFNGTDPRDASDEFLTAWLSGVRNIVDTLLRAGPHTTLRTSIPLAIEAVELSREALPYLWASADLAAAASTPLRQEVGVIGPWRLVLDVPGELRNKVQASFGTSESPIDPGRIKKFKRMAELAYKLYRKAGVADRTLKGDLTIKVRKEGADRGSAGWYQPAGAGANELVLYADRVGLYGKGDVGIEDGSWTLIHELAHRVYYRGLTANGRNYWNALINALGKKLSDAMKFKVFDNIQKKRGESGERFVTQGWSKGGTVSREEEQAAETIAWWFHNQYPKESNLYIVKWLDQKKYSDLLPTNYANATPREAWPEVVAAMLLRRARDSGGRKVSDQIKAVAVKLLRQTSESLEEATAIKSPFDVKGWRLGLFIIDLEAVEDLDPERWGREVIAVRDWSEFKHYKKAGSAILVAVLAEPSVLARFLLRPQSVVDLTVLTDASLESQVVAYTALTQGEKSEPFYSPSMIEVHPKQRRQGIASTLWHHLRANLRKQGVPLGHSSKQTDDGKAWAGAVGEALTESERASVRALLEAQGFSATSVAVMFKVPPSLAAQFPDKGEHDPTEPHISVLIIGEIDDDEWRTTQYVVREVASELRPFSAHFGKYGEFKIAGKGGAVVAWVGIESPMLWELHSGLWRKLKEAGVQPGHRYGDHGNPDNPQKRLYHAHATLAYMAKGETFTGRIPTGSWNVSAFEVWRGSSVKVPVKLGGPKPAMMMAESVYYHGTDADPFEQFDSTKIGSSTDSGLLGRGFYFSTDRNIGRNRRTLLRASLHFLNPLKITATSWEPNKLRLVNDALGVEGLRGAALTRALLLKGYDAVILDYSPVGYRHQEVMVPKASQIKGTALAEAAWGTGDHAITTDKGGEGFWGNAGAGVLPISSSTGRILIGLRSRHVNEPGTWGLFGGAIDSGEQPEHAARREMQEELGCCTNLKLHKAFVFTSPGGGFRFSNFVGVVDAEFVPKLDWETETTKWVTFDELKRHPKMHFGLKALLDNSGALIKRLARPTNESAPRGELIERSFSENDIPDNFYLVTRMESAFDDLMRGVFPGVKGIAADGRVLASIGMGSAGFVVALPGRETVALNKLSRVMYDNPDYWVQDDFSAAKRVLNSRSGKSAGDKIIHSAHERARKRKRFSDTLGRSYELPMEFMQWGGAPVRNLATWARRLANNAKVLQKKRGGPGTWPYLDAVATLSPADWAEFLKMGTAALADRYVIEGEWLVKDEKLRVPKDTQVRAAEPVGGFHPKHEEMLTKLATKYYVVRVPQRDWDDTIKYMRDEEMARWKRVSESRLSEGQVEEERRVVRTRTPRKPGRDTGARYDWGTEDGFNEGDRLTVYHGFSYWKGALIAARSGLSGRDLAARRYSYENDNNPRGLFVSLDAKQASEFAGGAGAQAFIEFDCKYSELEAPVWPGGGFASQGQYAPEFGHGGDGRDAKREAARLAQRAKAKSSDIATIASSSRPELAATLLGVEWQALFVGDLNPERIRAIWYRPSYRESFKRYKRQEFIKAHGSGKLSMDDMRNAGFEGGDYARRKALGFKPQDDWDAEMFKKLFAKRARVPVGEVEGEISDPQWMLQHVSGMLWPKQLPGYVKWVKQRFGFDVKLAESIAPDHAARNLPTRPNSMVKLQQVEMSLDLLREERDYRREYREYHGKPEQRKQRSMRGKARRKLGLKKGDPREVDHKKPLSKGGGNGNGNLRAVSRNTNRKKADKVESVKTLSEADPQRDARFRAIAVRAHGDMVAWVKRRLAWAKERREQSIISDAFDGYNRMPRFGGWVVPWPDISEKSAKFENLAIVFGHSKQNASMGTSNNGHLNVMVLPCLRAAFDTTYLDTRIASANLRTAFVHEFVHFLDTRRRKSGVGASGARARSGDMAGYYQDPGEFNAYFQEGADRLTDYLEKALDRNPKYWTSHTYAAFDAVKGSPHKFVAWAIRNPTTAFWDERFLEYIKGTKWERKLITRLTQLQQHLQRTADFSKVPVRESAVAMSGSAEVMSGLARAWDEWATKPSWEKRGQSAWYASPETKRVLGLGPNDRVPAWVRRLKRRDLVGEAYDNGPKLPGPQVKKDPEKRVKAITDRERKPLNDAKPWGEVVQVTERIMQKLDFNAYARSVADAYDARPVHDAAAKASYAALLHHSEKMFKQLTSRIDIKFVDESEPYADAADMTKRVKEEGVMYVSKLFSSNLPSGWTPEQNWRFRAVHDYIVHIGGRHDFSLRGEIATFNRHAKVAPRAALPALFSEIVGQVAYYFARGKFPSPQKACILYGFDYERVGYINPSEFKRNFVNEAAPRKLPDPRKRAQKVIKIQTRAKERETAEKAKHAERLRGIQQKAQQQTADAITEGDDIIDDILNILDTSTAGRALKAQVSKLRKPPRGIHLRADGPSRLTDVFVTRSVRGDTPGKPWRVTLMNGDDPQGHANLPTLERAIEYAETMMPKFIMHALVERALAEHLEGLNSAGTCLIRGVYGDGPFRPEKPVTTLPQYT
jgi:8-oxo-dGTP pyrophosphatase MutT (NUDIX family)/GNAT superfamily N-acetyltransferase